MEPPVLVSDEHAGTQSSLVEHVDPAGQPVVALTHAPASHCVPHGQSVEVPQVRRVQTDATQATGPQAGRHSPSFAHDVPSVRAAPGSNRQVPRPITPMPRVERVLFVVTRRLLEVTRVTGVDAQGITTSIDFNRARTNTGVPATVTFQWVPPPGVQVVTPPRANARTASSPPIATP